jgi:hypothetical protein
MFNLYEILRNAHGGHALDNLGGGRSPMGPGRPPSAAPGQAGGGQGGLGGILASILRTLTSRPGAAPGPGPPAGPAAPSGSPQAPGFDAASIQAGLEALTKILQPGTPAASTLKSTRSWRQAPLKAAASHPRLRSCWGALAWAHCAWTCPRLCSGARRCGHSAGIPAPYQPRPVGRASCGRLQILVQVKVKSGNGARRLGFHPHHVAR